MKKAPGFCLYKAPRVTGGGYAYVGYVRLPDGTFYWVEANAIPAAPNKKAHFEGVVLADINRLDAKQELLPLAPAEQEFNDSLEGL